MINAVDIICGTIVVVFAVLGIRAGFLSSIFSLILVYVSVFFASSVSSAAAGGFNFLGVSYQVASAVLFLLLFLLFDLFGEFINWSLKKLLQIKLFGILDALVAGLLGGLKAVLILGILFGSLQIFQMPQDTQKIIDSSFFKNFSIKVYKRSYPFAQSVVPKVMKAVNPESKTINPAKSVLNTIQTVTEEALQIMKDLTK